MYVDKLLEFDDANSLTVARASTNVVDTQVLRDLGIGEPLFIVVQVATVFTDTHAVVVTLEGDADDTWGGTTISTIGTLAGTSAVGTKLIQIMPWAATYYRYLRLYYTPADTISGAIDAFITNYPGVQYIYASGFSVA